jgi:hypothetical protein
VRIATIAALVFIASERSSHERYAGRRLRYAGSEPIEGQKHRNHADRSDNASRALGANAASPEVELKFRRFRHGTALHLNSLES